MKDDDIGEFYNKYTSILDEELSEVGSMIKNTMSEEEVSELALRLAISSYAQKLACECLIGTMSEDESK